MHFQQGVGEASLQHMENVHPLYLSQYTEARHMLPWLSFTNTGAAPGGTVKRWEKLQAYCVLFIQEDFAAVEDPSKC